MKKLKWGVLSTAKIGLEKVLPAITKSNNGEVYAIASRSAEQAGKAAAQLGIPHTYSSYEDLLNDPEVEAVYNPLPNNLHIEWTRKALEAGKHVLCEKPLALNSSEIKELIKLRDKTGLCVSEAFMVRYHPQWLTTARIVREGQLGQMRTIQGFFSYYNIDTSNIRNIKELGGGGLLDIGCYPITTSRLIFDEEPTRVASVIEYDPDTKVDRLCSAMLDFPSGQASFTCSTQLVPYQRMNIYGTEGRAEVEIPFNAPPDQACRVFLSKGSRYYEDYEILDFPVCDQYTLQAESFVQSIRGEKSKAVPLEDALNNMKVIEALFKAGSSGKWEEVL